MRILHTIATFIAITFFSTATTAQISDSLYNALPDSLKPHIKNSVSVVEKQRLLLYSSDYKASHYRNELGGFVTSLLQETLAKPSLKVDNLKAVAAYYNNYRSDSAVFFNQKLIAAIGNNSRYLADLPWFYLSLGTAYIYLDKYDSAINELNNISRYANIKDTDFMGSYYSTYGFLYNSLAIYDKAIFYGKRVIEFCPSISKWTDGYVDQVIDNAVVYAQLFKQTHEKTYSDSAYNIIRNVMDVTKKNGAYWFNGCYYLLGFLDYLNKDYTHAIKMFDSSALPVYNQTSKFYAPNYYGKYLYKAVCLVKLGKYGAGKAILDTLKIYTANYTSKQVKYEALCEQAEHTGSFKAALAYHKQFVLYSDSLDLEGQKGRVFEAEQKYSVKEKEADIAVLQTKNLQEKAARLGWVIGFLCALVALLLLYVYYRGKLASRASEARLLADRLNMMEKEMVAKQLKQVAENKQALVMQREDISRSMHDEVSSSLAALVFLIKNMRADAHSNEAKMLLANIEEEADSLYVQAREFMHRLHENSGILEYNLPEFLDNLSLTFGAGSSLRIETEYNRESIESAFSAEQHAETYLFVKEAVTNCMKHSGATWLAIKTYFEKNIFHIRIADNGKGSTGYSQGIGLNSMMKRIQALGGEVKFDVGNGFNIAAEFPV